MMSEPLDDTATLDITKDQLDRYGPDDDEWRRQNTCLFFAVAVPCVAVVLVNTVSTLLLAS